MIPLRKASLGGRILRALRAAPAAALLAAAPAGALVGEWSSFTNVSAVRDLEYFQGELWAATGGGIRRVPMDGRPETLYDNTDGLVDVSIQGLVATPEGELWAASLSGVLYRLARDKSRWEAQGLSYRSAGWVVKKRAMLYRSPYLILGSTKGLSFYDTRKGRAEVNITRMGSTVGPSVNGLLLVGDTLFAGTDKGIYRATLKLDSLTTSVAVDIYNPAIWALVPRTAGAMYFRPADPDTAPPDTLIPATATVDSAHGMLFYGANGVASEYEGDRDGPGERVERYGMLRLVGADYANRWEFETMKRVGERVFTGTAFGLNEFVLPMGRLSLIQPAQELPRSEFTMIAAVGGSVYAYAEPGLHTLEGSAWRRLSEPSLPSASVDANRAGAHPFHVFDRDRIYFGSWGQGFTAWEDGRLRSFGSGDAGGSCLQGAVQAHPEYVVVRSLAPYRRQGVWLATFHEFMDYKLAYYDAATHTMQCFDVASRSLKASSLEVVHDSLLVVVHEGGVDTWRIRERDGRVSLETSNRTPQLRTSEPTHSGRFDKLGNYWVTTAGGPMYFISRFGPDSLGGAAFSVLEGFPGSECKSISRDLRGHLWVGCTEGGLVEIIPGRDSATHAFRRYGSKDGLLSENIYHLSADTSNGHVWMVTDRGLARYESPSRTVAPKLREARAFPNPFLSRHSQVVFDNLGSGSRLQVMTQGGAVVYSRSLTAADGHQLRWDGRNQSGARVREGVYFYVVRSGDSVFRGKLIVAR